MTTRIWPILPGTALVDGWQLTPEGAAVHAGERTAVIADVHLGYEWARGAAGDCVPAHSLAETLARLEGVLGAAVVSRLVVAGDLVESGRRCARTAADVRRLRAWLAARGVALLALEGNHDRLLGSALSAAPGEPSSLPATCAVGGWTIGHGHRPIAGSRTISGHHHPIFRFEGTIASCFLIGTRRIVLPAFSRNAAGYDVASMPVPEVWRKANLRCIVSTGYDLLDFGLLRDLARRLRLASDRKTKMAALPSLGSPPLSAESIDRSQPGERPQSQERHVGTATGT
jgi:putative SbcD/Mre11-related phosphoesterase